MISAFHDEHKKKTSLWIFCRLLWAWMLPKSLLVWEGSIMSNSTQISLEQLHLWLLLNHNKKSSTTNTPFVNCCRNSRPSAAQQCRSGIVPSSPDCAYPQCFTWPCRNFCWSKPLPGKRLGIRHLNDSQQTKKNPLLSLKPLRWCRSWGEIAKIFYPAYMAMGPNLGIKGTQDSWYLVLAQSI